MQFEHIWSQYERELSAFVLSRVRNREIQKDVMQEVALKIFTSLHLQKEHLRGWLYVITKNVINDYYRKSHKSLPLLQEHEESKEHILSECLKPMLQTLKKEDQEILKLTQLELYSLVEVATQKNLSHAAVKSRLYRAKKALAKSFFSCCTYEKNARGDVVEFDCDDKHKC